MQYGFEREYFVLKDGKPTLVPRSLAHDECGFLAEARGEPHRDPLKAAYLLLAEEDRLKAEAARLGLELRTVDTWTLNPKLVRDAIRQFGKGIYPTERGNIYGLDYKVNDARPRAGLHVHFSNPTIVGKQTVYGSLNIPAIVQKLDKAFGPVIKKAHRIPGLYEMKTWGFEYRSLPTSVNPVAVAKFLASAA